MDRGEQHCVNFFVICLGHVWHGLTPLQSCSAPELHGGATLLQSFDDVWQERCS
jgi:hypothetical protein